MTRPPLTTETPPYPSSPGFVLFTTPIHLDCLEEDSRHCPICSEPYIEPQKTRPSPENTTEWAMRVDMSATDEGSTKCCRHIFGRRCLEKHINSRGAWHNKCPLCRQLWWIAPQVSPEHSSRAPTSRRGVRDGRVRRRRESVGRQDRPSRSGFVRQILDTFAVEEGSEQIEATVHEVEERLALMYENRGQSVGQGSEAPVFNRE